MNRCKDYPDCGHEPGGCPEEFNRQPDMVCCLCNERIAVSSLLERVCKDCYDKNFGNDDDEYFGTYMDDI